MTKFKTGTQIIHLIFSTKESQKLSSLVFQAKATQKTFIPLFFKPKNLQKMMLIFSVFLKGERREAKLPHVLRLLELRKSESLVKMEDME